MGQRVAEAAVREVGRGQIVQGLRSHRKEVSFIQRAVGGQWGFKPGSNLIRFVFYKDPLVYCMENWIPGARVGTGRHKEAALIVQESDDGGGTGEK